MRKVSFAGLLVTFFVTGCGESLVSLPKYDEMKNIREASAPLQRAAEAIVKISAPAGSGTGSFLSLDGILLTNNHVLGIDGSACAAEGCHIKIYRHRQIGSALEVGESVFAEPLRVSAEMDAAVYQLWTNSAKTTKVNSKVALEINPQSAAELMGTTVNVIGHPRGALKKWTVGQVYQTNHDWIQSTNFCLGGNSGSPFLDEAGKIVGLLHRSSHGGDLITKRDALYASIGSAGNVLKKFQSTPVSVSAFFSVKVPHTLAEITDHHEAYLMAHERNAIGSDNKPIPVLEALGQSCDLALAKVHFKSPEDLEKNLSPCSDAWDWMNCTNGRDSEVKACPDRESAKKWTARWQKAAELAGSFNDRSFLSWLVSPWRLQSSTREATSTARTFLASRLAKQEFALDQHLAYYLLDAYGTSAEYRGRSVVEYVKQYRSQAHYEFHYGWIINSHEMLYRYDALSAAEFAKAINEMLSDEKLNLGNKLDLEASAYEYGLL